MRKILNTLNLKIVMKSFIFCNNLLKEKPHTLFLGLLSQKQKQNKKPDILKVIFTEGFLGLLPTPSPLEFRVSSFIWRRGKRRYRVGFSFSCLGYYCVVNNIRKYSKIVPLKNTQVVPVGLEYSQGNEYFLKNFPASHDDQSSLRSVEMTDSWPDLIRMYTRTSCCITTCFCVTLDKYVCVLDLFKGVCWNLQKGLALSIISLRPNHL